MPTVFIYLTIISGISFIGALGWVFYQWSKADQESEQAEAELRKRLTESRKT